MEPSDLKYKDIQSKSAHGIKWMGISEMIVRVLQFFTTIIIARILTPEDFGIFGVTIVFIQLTNVLFDFGFTTALIQKKNITNIYKSTTFVIYFLSAIVFMPVLIFSAKYVALFFEEPVIENVLQALSIVFILNAFKSIPYVQAQRDMLFKKFSIIQLVSILCYSAVTIASAFLGAGVWSFVIGSLAEQASLTLLLNLYMWWKPSFKFDYGTFKELLNFGSNVIGSRLIGQLILNSPSFIIGKLLGITAVGYYNIAFQLVEFPVQRISKNVLRVMFPAFSKLQDDLVRFRDLFKTIFYHLLMILLPIFAGLIIIAPEIVTLFYGEKWAPSILPLQLLAAAGLFRSIWISMSAIFLSKGKPKTELVINIFFAIVLIPALIFMSGYGLSYVAGTVSFVTMIFLVIAQVKALNIIEMPVLRFQKVYLLPISGVLLFVLTIVLLNQVGLAELTVLNRLISTIVICVSLYGTTIVIFDRKIFKKLAAFIGMS